MDKFIYEMPVSISWGYILKKTRKILITVIITILLLIVIFNIAPSILNEEPKEQNLKPKDGIIYVDDDNTKSPWYGTKEHPYDRINDAILNAEDGNTINILKGIYYETITIDKPLTITGEDKNNTIIDGIYQEYVIKTKSDKVIIKDLTIRNSGGYKFDAGVKLNSNDNKIVNCIFYRTKTAVYANGTDGHEINNCVFHTNGEGINLDKAKNCKINNCLFTHNAQGFNIQGSNDVKINDCYAHTNGIGVFLDDSSNIEITQCAIYDNNDNQGGFSLNNCNNINIKNSHINHNGFGINIADSSKITISNCDLHYAGHMAIQVRKNSEEITIENCEISENLRYAVSVYDSKCTIKNNNFHRNLFGLYTEKSICDARNNWWGSALGPALLEHNVRDRFSVKFGITRLFPWKPKENNDVGSNWEINKKLYDIKINTSRFEQIKLDGSDSDNDLIPDWWEKKYKYNPLVWDDHANLDPDNDGLNNIEECFTDQWGSSPNYKDIFLEIDWIETAAPGNSANRPPKDYMNDMIKVFAEHDIALHMDDGSLGGGEKIPYVPSFSLADMRDLYWEYFLNNDLNNPRKGVFHYCLISDFGPKPGGPGFAFMGWDNVDSFSISAQRIYENRPLPLVTKDRIVIGVIIHELGHTLGLFPDDHGGNDNTLASDLFRLQWLKYRNYKSCMNYCYTYRILDYSDGSHGRNDFDDWGNLDFYFFKNSHFEWPK